MIKTAIKHYILEACINMLFSKIQDNFISKERDLWCARIGDKFKRIVGRDLDMDDGRGRGNYTFTNCVVRRAGKYSLDFSGYYVEGGRYSHPYIKYWAIVDYIK